MSHNLHGGTQGGAQGQAECELPNRDTKRYSQSRPYSDSRTGGALFRSRSLCFSLIFHMSHFQKCVYTQVVSEIFSSRFKLEFECPPQPS